MTSSSATAGRKKGRAGEWGERGKGEKIKDKRYKKQDKKEVFDCKTA